MEANLKAAIWHFRHFIEQIGVFGIVGIGLLAFSVMLYAFSVIPAENEFGRLQKKDEARAWQKASVSTLQPQDQLRRFYGSLAKSDSATDVLAKLHKISSKQGVSLESGEYRFVRSNTDRLVRYGITLPIKGSYTNIRKFIFQSLAEIPALSLDVVEFKRSDINDPALETRVGMTLFLIN